MKKYEGNDDENRELRRIFGSNWEEERKGELEMIAQ
jgi:hypothetical protein